MVIKYNNNNINNNFRRYYNNQYKNTYMFFITTCIFMIINVTLNCNTIFASGKSLNYEKKKKYYEDIGKLYTKDRPLVNPYNLKNPQKKRFPTKGKHNKHANNPWSPSFNPFEKKARKKKEEKEKKEKKEKNKVETFHYYHGIEKIGRPPNLPLQFQVKIIFETVYPVTGYVKILCLYHYDYVNQRTRYDLYKIKDNKHAQRYFTMIKKYDEGKKWIVFHRVRDGPLPNPTGCMVVAVNDEMLHPSLLHYHGIYRGEHNVSVYKNLKFEQEHNLPTHSWALKFKKKWYYYYETEFSRKPVRLQFENVNGTVIHLEEGPHTVKPNIFDVETVTNVECQPFANPL